MSKDSNVHCFFFSPPALGPGCWFSLRMKGRFELNAPRGPAVQISQCHVNRYVVSICDEVASTEGGLLRSKRTLLLDPAPLVVPEVPLLELSFEGGWDWTGWRFRRGSIGLVEVQNSSNSNTLYQRMDLQSALPNSNFNSARHLVKINECQEEFLNHFTFFLHVPCSHFESW